MVSELGATYACIHRQRSDQPYAALARTDGSHRLRRRVCGCCCLCFGGTF